MDHEPEIPWQRLATFVRQHTHDVRNHLNSLDLEAALLSDLVTGGEAKESVDRLRKQIRGFAGEMRSLSGKFADPPVGRAVVPASLLFLIWKDQTAHVDPTPDVVWEEEVGESRLTIDPDGMAHIFRELLTNAVAFGSGQPLRAEARAHDQHVSFTLTEPKTEPVDPSQWGRVPLTSTRRGRYGLGLWVVDRNVAASHGQVERRYHSPAKQLVTTLRFPTQQ